MQRKSRRPCDGSTLGPSASSRVSVLMYWMNVFNIMHCMHLTLRVALRFSHCDKIPRQPCRLRSRQVLCKPFYTSVRLKAGGLSGDQKRCQWRRVANKGQPLALSFMPWTGPRCRRAKQTSSSLRYSLPVPKPLVSQCIPVACISGMALSVRHPHSRHIGP